MTKHTELIATNVELRREVVDPNLAALMGREALTLFDSPGYPLSLYIHPSVEELGLTTLRFSYGRNNIPRSQLAEQRDICESLAEHPETANIGEQLIRAQRRKHCGRFPLTGLNIHSNTPDTQFSAHVDLATGKAYSLALSKAIFRLHDEEDNVLEERTLDPGDEVLIVSPKNPKKRPKHSFATLPQTPRVALVRKYKRRHEMKELTYSIQDIGY